MGLARLAYVSVGRRPRFRSHVHVCSRCRLRCRLGPAAALPPFPPSSPRPLPGAKGLCRVGFFAAWGRFPRERAPASFQEVMFRRALLLMIIVFAGAACEELPEPKTPCRTEEECRGQAKLCHYSCAHPRALKTCTRCCLDMERKCVLCEEKYEFNSCD